MVISLQLENKEALDLIAKAVGKMEDLSFEFGEIARSLAKYNRTNFILKGYGKYAPLSAAYAEWKARKFPGRPILVRTGRLRDSVTDATRPSKDTILVIKKDGMAHGSKVPYSGFVQDGTRKMPARPYLFWDDARVRIVQRILQTGMERRFGNG